MRRALVVGLDEYSFGQLYGCGKDAKEIGELLRRNADGSRNFDVRLITTPPEPVTRVSLREAINDLFSQPAEVALFYFAGHGSENDLGGYLLTPDSTTFDDGVPMRELIEQANRSNVTEVVLLLDCCHSGHLGNAPRGPRESNEQVVIREGVTILTASRSSQAAMEVDGRGLFTSLVCSGLDGGAADVLGRVKVSGIFAYVDESLGAWQQRPLYKSHVSSLLCLRECASAIPTDELRRLTEFFPTETGEFRLDPSFERTHDDATPEHVRDYDVLVRYRNARLIFVTEHEHLYYAAIESGPVRLTALGKHYWQLVRDELL
jgi:hypothetical protein